MDLPSSLYIIHDLYKLVLFCFYEVPFADHSASSVYTYRGFYGKCKGPVPDQRFARRGHQFDFASSLRTFTHFGNAANPQQCWNCGFACMLSFVCLRACAFNVCSHIRTLTCEFRCVRMCALYACFPFWYAWVHSTCTFHVCSHIRALTCMSSMYVCVCARERALDVCSSGCLYSHLCTLICMLSMRAIDDAFTGVLSICVLSHKNSHVCEPPSKSSVKMPVAKYKLSVFWGGAIAF